MEGKIERLHLKGINQQMSDQDLLQFCSKIGKVCELHRPNTLTGTGLQKDFAIVKIEAVPDRTEKLIKALSGSIWKGCKVRISKANEFYKDKIERERRSETFLPNKDNGPFSKNHKPVALPSDMKPIYLRIRRAKGLPIIKTSSRPLLYLQSKPYKFNDGKELFHARNRKIIFDNVDSYLLPPNYVAISENLPATMPNLERLTVRPPLKSGKGVRRGFGTLMQVDCCIEEVGIPDNFLDTEEIEASSVCGELSHEALNQERERALNVLHSLRKPSHAKIDETEKGRNFNLEDTFVEENSSRNNTALELNGESLVVDSIPLLQDKYVNVQEIKNIFAKSDGIWWNDQEVKITSESAEIRGNLRDDIIFQEAEKLGFDIRGDGNDSSKINNKRNFKLFSDDQADQADDGQSTTHITPSNRSESQATKVSTFEDNFLGSPFFHFIFTEEDLEMAKQFVATQSRAEIEEEWRATRREKLWDLKKRVRDSARKKASR